MSSESQIVYDSQSIDYSAPNFKGMNLGNIDHLFEDILNVNFNSNDYLILKREKSKLTIKCNNKYSFTDGRIMNTFFNSLLFNISVLTIEKKHIKREDPNLDIKSFLFSLTNKETLTIYEGEIEIQR